MRNLETVLCHRHLRSQPRYPRFTLCPDCRSEAPREAIVLEAVVSYFSRPEFRELFIETEREIQMGIDRRRADIVLLDRTESFLIIAECKRRGVVTYARDQLESYLCAADTPFGVFANSIDPNDWKFYENLRRNRFKYLTRDEFDETVLEVREAGSIREEFTEEIVKLERDRENVKKEIDEDSQKQTRLKRQIRNLEEERSEKQSALEQLTQSVNLLVLKQSELEIEIERYRQERSEKQSALEQLTHEIYEQARRTDDLTREIDEKTQQRQHLQEEIEQLEQNRGELQNELQTERQNGARELIRLRDQKNELRGEVEKLEVKVNRLIQCKKDQQIEIERLKTDIEQRTITILSPKQVSRAVLYHRNDIHITVAISSRDAARGRELQMEVRGKLLQVYVPPNTKHHQVVCLRGEGQPAENGSAGDLYVTVSVKRRFRINPFSRQ